MAKSSDDVVSTDVEQNKNKRVYWIMVLLGAGLLLPWNVILNAVDYLETQYPGEPIAFWISIAYIAPQLPILGLMVKWGNLLSYTARIVVGFFVQAVVLVLLPILSKYSYWTVLGNVFMTGVCCAVLQSSMFGFASQFPAAYNQALMAGQGIAGVGASFVRIIVKAGFAGHVQESALFYFLLGCAIIVICTVAYVALLRMPFVHFHLRYSSPKPSKSAPIPRRVVEEDTNSVAENWRSIGPGVDIKTRNTRQGSDLLDAPLLLDGPTRSAGLSSSAPHVSPMHTAMASGFENETHQSGWRTHPGTSSSAAPQLASPQGVEVVDVSDRKDQRRRLPSHAAIAPTDDAHAVNHHDAESGRRGRRPSGGDGGGYGTTPVKGHAGAAKDRERRPSLTNWLDTPLGMKIGRNGRGAKENEAVLSHLRRGSDASEEESLLHDAGPVSIMAIVRRTWRMMFVLVTVFVVTFLVFPGEIVEIKYQNTIPGIDFLAENGWWSVVLVTVFNVFDTIGRSLPSQKIIFKENGLFIFSIARWVFVPALVAAHHYTTIFNDVVVFLVMAVFAFTNGYTCSLAMMFAPAKVHPHERETAGLLLTLCLQLGIFCGSVFALALQAIFG